MTGHLLNLSQHYEKTFKMVWQVVKLSLCLSHSSKYIYSTRPFFFNWTLLWTRHLIAIYFTLGFLLIIVTHENCATWIWIIINHQYKKIWNRKCTSEGNVIVDMFYFSAAGASRFLIYSYAWFSHEHRRIGPRGIRENSERSQTITDPHPYFNWETNSSLGYRQTFQMCIMSRNDVSFFQWIGTGRGQ